MRPRLPRNLYMKQILPDQALLNMRAPQKRRHMIWAVTVIREWGSQRKGRSRPVFYADVGKPGCMAVPVSTESRGHIDREGNPVHVAVPANAESRGHRDREENPVHLVVPESAESRDHRDREGNLGRLAVPVSAVRRARRE